MKPIRRDLNFTKTIVPKQISYCILKFMTFHIV